MSTILKAGTIDNYLKFTKYKFIDYLNYVIFMNRLVQLYIVD